MNSRRIVTRQGADQGSCELGASSLRSPWTETRAVLPGNVATPTSFNSRVNQLSIDIAIIGAGPYGLSVASYLRASGMNFRIFGRPMHSWQANMPVGMYLKSEGFASNLSDPSGSFTLERFHRDSGLAYSERAAAIPLDQFLAYGLAFQKRFVPEVDERAVATVRRRANSFEITMEDGEILIAGRVLMAIGLHPFRHMPACARLASPGACVS